MIVMGNSTSVWIVFKKHGLNILINHIHPYIYIYIYIFVVLFSSLIYVSQFPFWENIIDNYLPILENYEGKYG